MKNILKNKCTLLNLIFTILLSWLLSNFIIFNKIEINTILKNDVFLFILCFCFLFFVTGHFIFPIKKYYKFIYSKRWILAIFLLTICVLGKFNLSSFGMWNYYIQPNNNISEMEPIIGSPLSIRSDEWLTSTSVILSQKYNDFNIKSELLRGAETSVYLYGSAPVKNILLLGRPFSIGYILLGDDYGASFAWCGRIIILFMITFEFLMILTKKNKVTSVIGTCLITFSSPTAWWGLTIIDLLIGGEGAIVSINNIIESENKFLIVLNSLLLLIFILMFGFVLYPAWIVPLLYIFGVIGIYLLITAIKNKKINLFKIISLIIVFFLCIFFVIYFLIINKNDIISMMSTVYPGARFINGGSDFKILFFTMFNVFTPFKYLSNPCEVASFYAFYPITIIMVIYYFFKNKRNSNLLIVLLSIVFLLFGIFIFVGVPDLIAKYLLLYMVPVDRLIVIFSYLSLLLLCIVRDNIKVKKNIVKLIFILLSIAFSIFIIYKGETLYSGYVNKLVLVLTILLEIYFTILWYFKENNVISCILLLSIFIVFSFMFANVNPISKGISSIYKKPIVEELNKIRDEEPDALWVALDDIVTSDYLLLNGLSVINSTNPYPVLERWNLIDTDKLNEDIYNRYAHIVVRISDDNTKFELIQSDAFSVDLNSDDFCKLNLSYLTSRSSIERYNTKTTKFNMIYNNDGLYIYKINCL